MTANTNAGAPDRLPLGFANDGGVAQPKRSLLDHAEVVESSLTNPNSPGHDAAYVELREALTDKGSKNGKVILDDAQASAIFKARAEDLGYADLAGLRQDRMIQYMNAAARRLRQGRNQRLKAWLMLTHATPASTSTEAAE